MPKHRHPQATVTDTDQRHNFDLANAIEDAVDDLARIEALAAAASAALDRLPRSSTVEERHAARTLYNLVTMTSEEAADALARADERVERLGEHLAAQRAGKAVRR